ncbi:MAG TPA: hypothetical protein VF636_10695, partial [Sphingomonas sp.]
FQAVVNCRAVADPQARLACFDQQVAALQAAEASRDVVVVDRQQMRETRRTLFGLSLPRLNIFGEGKDDEAEEVRQIETTLVRLDPGPYNKSLFTLADGSRWRQTDSKDILARPRPGAKVTVKRGVTSNFKLNVDGGTFAVRREN